MFFKKRIERKRKELLDIEFRTFANRMKREGEFFYPRKCEPIDHVILDRLLEIKKDARFEVDNIHGFEVWFFPIKNK